MAEREAQAAWFALAVKTMWEKRVAGVLECKGYEIFLPVYPSRRKRSDRTVTLDLPLFPGYVFCRFDVCRRLPILVTPGVWRIVGSGASPTPLENSEIESIRQAVNGRVPCTPWPYVRSGQRVSIIDGPLCGLEGILLSMNKKTRLVLSIELVQRSIAVEVDAASVRPIQPPAKPAAAATWKGGAPLAQTNAAGGSMTDLPARDIAWNHPRAGWGWRSE